MPRTTHHVRLRRTWPQRIVIVFNTICIVAALVTAGAVAYTKHTVSSLQRIDLTAAPGFKGTKGLTDKSPRNFLIVGVDSDAGLAPDDPVRNGRDSGPDPVVGLRSDTIMVVRIDPSKTAAQVLSFPRDLWVDIPGKSQNRMNSALEFGGADLLIETIKQDFGIDINHYVQVDFAGFQSMVKLLDGMPVYFSTPVKDQDGLNVQTAGCTTLDQYSALDYVRARHLKYQNANGRWVSDGTSDFGRISRQQDFMRRLIRRAVKQGARNPVKLADMVGVGVKNIKLDNDTTLKDLIELGTAFRNFDASSLKTYSLPVSDITRGGADVLDLQEAAAQPVLDLFRGTGTDATAGEVTPGAVTVQVRNGSGKANQAATTTDQLRALGFHTDSPDSSPIVARTEIHYPAGMEQQAVLVGRYLYANPLLVPDPGVSDVTVITGQDFGTVLTTPLPASHVVLPTTTTTSTTTTVAGATTTVPAGGTAASSSTTTPVTTTTVQGFVPTTPAGTSCG